MTTEELSHVRYFIDGSISTAIRAQLRVFLHSQGAQPCSPAPQPKIALSEASTSADLARTAAPFDVNDVTHIITASPSFVGSTAVESYNARVKAKAEAVGLAAGTAPAASGQRGQLIAVVSYKWLTRTYDLKKRQEEQYYSPDPNMLFSGVTVCTEDLPTGDSETIKGVVAALGGQWRQALTVDVTHLICTKQTGKKIERVLNTGWKIGMKAILPHWFDDCLRLQHRVPGDEYLFPNPPLLTDFASPNPKSFFERLQHYLGMNEVPQLSVQGAMVEEADRAVPAINSKVYLENVTHKLFHADHKPTTGILTGQKIYIAAACDLTNERLQMYGDLIASAGGTLLDGRDTVARSRDIVHADYVVVNYRESWEFWKAFDQGKEIGNLDWLVFVLFASRTSLNDPDSPASLPSPKSRILHYPWPRTTVPTFSSYIITISGYAGATRDAIKKMIEIMGARFEGNMTKGKTTHVISATYSGSKVQHAGLWNIPVVNHLWIEDCFLSWTARTPVRSEYTNYDGLGEGFSFSSLVGTREVKQAVVSDWSLRDEVQTEKSQALSRLQDILDASKSTMDVDDEEKKGTIGKLLTRPSTLEEIAATAPDHRGSSGNTLLPSSPRKSNGTMSMSKTPVSNVNGKMEDSATAEASVPVVKKPSLSEMSSSSSESDTDNDGDSRPASKAKRAGADTAGRPPLKRKLPNSVAPNTPEQQKSRGPKAGSSASAGENQPAASSSTQAAAKRKKTNMAAVMYEEAEYGADWTPRTNSMRNAAQKAAQRLHETVMPDVLAFAKELRGGGKKQLEQLFGGKDGSSPRKKGSLSSSATKPQRRENGAHHADSSDDDGNEGSDDSESHATKHKRAPPGPSATQNGRRRSSNMASKQALPPVATPNVSSRFSRARAKEIQSNVVETPTYQSADYSFDYPSEAVRKIPLSDSKVVLAGKPVKIASTGVGITDAVRRNLLKMGAHFLDKSSEGCSHVVVKAVSRTVKFLTAISSGAYFVTEQWAIDSADAGQFLDEEAYLLRDKEGEAKHVVNLAQSLARARRSKVFEDTIFYITPKVVPDFDSLKTIAESGGGKVYKKLPTLKAVQDRADIFVISSPEESGLWMGLYENGIPIYSGEAIIRSVMKQEMEFEPHALADTEDEI